MSLQSCKTAAVERCSDGRRGDLELVLRAHAGEFRRPEGEEETERQGEGEGGVGPVSLNFTTPMHSFPPAGISFPPGVLQIMLERR